jgi:hypothetical protein
MTRIPIYCVKLPFQASLCLGETSCNFLMNIINNQSLNSPFPFSRFFDSYFFSFLIIKMLSLIYSFLFLYFFYLSLFSVNNNKHPTLLYNTFLTLLCNFLSYIFFFFSTLLRDGIEPNPGWIYENNLDIEEISDNESNVDLVNDFLPNFDDLSLQINLPISDNSIYPHLTPPDNETDQARQLNLYQFHYIENSDLIRSCLDQMYSRLPLIDDNFNWFLSAYYNLLIYYSYPELPYARFVMTSGENSVVVFFEEQYSVQFTLDYGFILCQHGVETNFIALDYNLVEALAVDVGPFEVDDQLSHEDIRTIFIADNPDIASILLMHDIETNPGPESLNENFNDLVTLYMDVLNFTMLDEDSKNYYSNSIEIRFSSLKQKYKNSSSPALLKCLSDIDGYINVIPQMFSSLNPFTTLENPINNLSQSIKEAQLNINVSKETLEGISGIATKLSDVTLGIGESTQQFLTPSVPDVLGLKSIFNWLQSPKNSLCCLSVLMVILMLTRKRYPNDMQIMSLCAAFGLIAALSFNSAYIFSSISSWFSPGEVAPQSNDDDWISISMELLSLGFFSRSLKFTDISSFTIGLATIEKQSKTFSDFLDRIKKLVNKLVTRLAETFGVELNLGFDAHANKIRSFTTRLIALKRDACMFDGNVTFSFSRDVKILESDVNNYLCKVDAIKDNTSYTIGLQNVLRLMQPLLGVIKNSYIRRATRKVPFPVNFVGGSDVGKTSLAQVVIPTMFCQVGTEDAIERAGDDFTSICYAPGIGDKFYDSYNNQFAWLYNDFIQKREPEGAPVSEILTYIQMLGNSPMPLNCAEMGKKGITMFTSDTVFTSMNLFCITHADVKVLTHNRALTRRLNQFNVLVYIKPEFRSNNAPVDGVVYPPDEDQARFWAALDKDKARELGNGFNTQVYSFCEWDSETGTYKQGGFMDIDYHDMIDILIQRYEQHTHHQELMNARTARFVQDQIDAKKEENRLLALRRELEIEANAALPQSDNNEVFDSVPKFNIKSYFDKTDGISSDDYDMSNISMDIDDEFDDDGRYLILDSEDNSLCKWISRYIARCIKDNCRYVIGKDYGICPFVSKLYNNILATANWCDLFHLADVDYSNIVIYNSLRLRDKFYTIHESLYSVSCGLLMKISIEYEIFKVDPLKWCLRNPYLSLFGITGVVAGSALLYKGLSLGLDMVFKFFDCKPENKIYENIFGQGSTITDRDLAYMMSPCNNFHKLKANINLSDGRIISLSQSYAFGIKGHTFRIPFHVYNLWQAYYKRSKVVNIEIGFIPIKSMMTVPPLWFDIKNIVWNLDRSSEDIIYGSLPTCENQFGDITSYYPKKTPEFVKLLESRDKIQASAFFMRCGVMIREQVTLSYNGSHEYFIDSMIADEDGSYIPTASSSVSMDRTLRMNYPTQSGDCCMAVFITDPIFRTLTFIDPTLQNPFLCYVHNSGNSKINCGYGQVTFREDLISFPGLRLKNVPDLIREDSVLRTQIFNEVTGQSLDSVIFSDISEQPENFEPHHIVHGVLPKIQQSQNSAITRSELFYDIKKRYGITKMPSPSYGDPDPMELARSKYGSNINFSPHYPSIYVTADEVVSELFDNSGPILHTRKYTVKEVLEGVPCEGIRSNDRSTSWGYMMKLFIKRYGFTSDDARWAFGRGDKYEYDSPLAKVVLLLCSKYEFSLEEGNDVLAIYMDCLKDECRDSKKKRLFCACDKIFLLNCKQYFGGFANWIYVNRIRNGIAIGINPYSEWDIFYKWLTEVGKWGIFGDYEKYDKKQLNNLMFVTLIAIRRYYKDAPPQENLAREILFQKFMKTLHVTMSKGVTYLYEWFHGNTSGNLLTSIINSITGLMIVKYCISDIILSASGGIRTASSSQVQTVFKIVRKHFRVETYGDDNVIMMSDCMRESITFDAISKSIESNFGLVYTDELKGKRENYVIPPQTHILEGNFIARGFKHLRGVVVAILRFISLFEPLAWYKSTKDRLELIRNVERVLKELSLWGPDVFYLHQPFLAKICEEKLGVSPKFQLYEAAFYACCDEESLHFDPSFIYGPLNMEGYNFLRLD